MPLTVLTRKLVIEDCRAVAEGIHEGDEYYHEFREVAKELRSLDQVKVTQTPWVAIFGLDGSVEPLVSKTMAEEMEVVSVGYIRKDEDRWPGESTPDIAEEMIADYQKALDANPSRTVQVIMVGRLIEMAHDTEGAWSVWAIRDRYRLRRRR